jgi:hypothetical protein
MMKPLAFAVDLQEMLGQTGENVERVVDMLVTVSACCLSGHEVLAISRALFFWNQITSSGFGVCRVG